MKKLIVILCLLIWPQIAWGHGVKLFANIEDGHITGMAYFVGGAPAANCPLSLLDGQGNELQQSLTDEQGNFTMHVPQNNINGLSLHLSAGPGHSAIIDISNVNSTSYLQESNNTASIKSPDSHIAMEQLLERQLAPIKQQLLQLQAAQDAISLEKILAGLGYIIGLLGLAVYIHYWQRLKKLDAQNKHTVD